MDTHTHTQQGGVIEPRHRAACPYGPQCRGRHCAGIHFDERDARMQTTEAALTTR